MEKILENINELKNHINVVYNAYNTNLLKSAQLYSYSKEQDQFIKFHLEFNRNMFYHPKLAIAIKYMKEGNKDLLIYEGYDKTNEWFEDNETLLFHLKDFIYGINKTAKMHNRDYNNNLIIYYINEEIIKLCHDTLDELSTWRVRS